MNGLIPMVTIMNQAETSADESITIDFSKTRFISPIFALSFIVYVLGSKKHFSFSHLTDYLRVIGLGSYGIDSDKMRKSEFLAMMEGYAKKTYIPIVNFPTLSENDEIDAISSVVENIIIRQLNIPPNVATGLKYMVEETIDNIIEHSGSDRGYIFAQAYPQKGYLDLCIADRGVTLLGSYQRLADNEIASDLEAIKAANRGISSKNLPDAENRGYGIYTSKQMLVNGLGGEYLMISGSNFYFKCPKFDSFYSLPGTLRWNGTIIALRIPYCPSNFNYINFIE